MAAVKEKCRKENYSSISIAYKLVKDKRRKAQKSFLFVTEKRGAQKKGSLVLTDKPEYISIEWSVRTTAANESRKKTKMPKNFVQ